MNGPFVAPNFGGLTEFGSQSCSQYIGPIGRPNRPGMEEAPPDPDDSDHVHKETGMGADFSTEAGHTSRPPASAHAFADKPTPQSPDQAHSLRVMDEPIGRHNNGHVSDDDETEYRLSVPEIPGSLAESQNDSADGRTYGEADVRAYVADMRAAPAEERAGRTDKPAVDLGAVAEAIAIADQETIDDWRTETDLCEAAELAAADADYTSGNTVSGEDLQRRYGLS